MVQFGPMYPSIHSRRIRNMSNLIENVVSILWWSIRSPTYKIIMLTRTSTIHIKNKFSCGQMHSLNIVSIILAQYDYVKYRDNYINMQTCYMYIYNNIFIQFDNVLRRTHTNRVISSKFNTVIVSNQIYINNMSGSFYAFDIPVTFQFKALILTSSNKY